MPYTTFLSPSDLAEHLADPQWAIVDCRFDLARPEWGRDEYRKAHIPGAVFADLNEDLSSPVTERTGRHPLPDFTVFTQKLGQWGIRPDMQVVVYDTAVGAYAARFWCLLRMLGHAAVAVLDGDFNRWQREGYPVRDGEEYPTPQVYTAQVSDAWIASAGEVERYRTAADFRIIDARSAERFQGKAEPIDPVAGRIPGSVNRFHGENLQPDGTIKPPEQLRKEFTALLGDVPPENAIVYCGSGVTSCLHLVAMEHAGLPGARLYAGSWSEWIRDHNRPVARDA
jgi:thiosulfate/3-mercaptopyruvate sulfurtransferase